MTLTHSSTPSVSETADPTWLGGLGTLLTATALGFIAGPVGVLAGGLLALCWYRFPTVYAFAFGHVVLAVGLTYTAPLTEFAPVETGLFLMLVGPAMRDESPARTIATTLACFLGLLTVGWTVRSSTDGLWLVATALLGSVAFLAYGIHRYELVRFGLVEVES